MLLKGNSRLWGSCQVLRDFGYWEASKGCKGAVCSGRFRGYDKR